ncbi:hypothetical protein RJ640_000223 [Escallonia rubra]|uniref:Retrotransposon gag domain-containing protein n=1 Tax=Escallonia rubra TaxID=112253 RepID=A0AA88RJ19_9ASTE|nr:hypothetical protein RJ640_000223 [Escallonia rubra]
MEREFQNRFYNTRRSVSTMELTNTKQGKEEPVVDYINRWRALSLDCKERLSEASAVEMCMQGMHWGLLYILQGNKPRTFEELATRGHNMEITKASHGGSNPSIGDPREDTREARWRWGSKATTKDSMVVIATPLKTTDKHNKEKQDKNKNQPQGKESQWLRLKELEQKVYPFSDSEVPGILDFLLEHKLIDLPKMKRVEEAGQVNESRYCKYHRLISHLTEKCFTLKEEIMDLSKKGKIHVDDERVEESNTTSVIFRPAVSSAFCQQQENGSPRAACWGHPKIERSPKRLSILLKPLKIFKPGFEGQCRIVWLKIKLRSPSTSYKSSSSDQASSPDSKVNIVSSSWRSSFEALQLVASLLHPIKLQARIRRSTRDYAKEDESNLVSCQAHFQGDKDQKWSLSCESAGANVMPVVALASVNSSANGQDKVGVGSSMADEHAPPPKL